MKLNGWICFLVFAFISKVVHSEIAKVVSMYGRYTSQNNLYKNIMIDASTYVNDGRILPVGDQLNIIHNNLLEEGIFEDRSVFQSVFQVCNDIRNTGSQALILPNDFCYKCDDIGSIIGEAYSPVMALDQADGSAAFKMRPIMSEMEEMLTKVIVNFRWESFIFLYEGDIAFNMVETMSATGVQHEWDVSPVELEVGNFRNQAEYIKTRNIKNILIYVTNEEVLKEVVASAFETRLLSNGWHWIFGNLNPPITQQFLEENYRHNMAFLTRFKVESNELKYISSSVEEPIKDWQFRERAAYDAVVSVAMALNFHKRDNGRFPRPVETCDQGASSNLERYLRQVNFRGASGDISFNEKGDRVNYTVIMYSGKDQYTENVAGWFVQDIRSWEQAQRQTWPGKPGDRMYIKPYRQADANFIKILMVPEPPFFMDEGEEASRYKVKRQTTPESNAGYKGIAIDLLKEVQKIFQDEMGIDFTYRVFEMSRGQYGTLDLSTGNWDGAVREIIDGDADVIMGSLTKNDAREVDIDFSAPWYETHIKLLILHPSFTFEYPFVLAYPLKIETWFALLVIFVIISLTVWFLGRCSPYEWRGRSRRDMASEEEGQTFTVPEAFAFTLSTGFWQGYTKGPRSWSLRIVAAFWFWFAISITFLYLWNLNSVFKFSKTALRVQDTADLLGQDQFEFGLVRGSPSYDFYRYGNGQDRQVFDRVLNSELDLIENRIEDAVLRMRRQWDGKFTLLGEEKILQFAAQRKPCRLYITGQTLGRMQFAFATASGSPLRDQLTYVTRLLTRRGVIDEIASRQYSEHLNCPNTTFFKEGSRESFSVHDLQGIYYILLIGIGGSLIVFFLEILIYILWFPGGKDRIPMRRTNYGGDGGGGNTTSAADTGIDYAPKSGGDWL